METIATSVHPDLRPVLGPLERAEEQRLYELLDEASQLVSALATSLNSRAGQEGQGFELSMLPYGQKKISTFVVIPGGGPEFLLEFLLELRPAGYWDKPPPAVASAPWEIEGEIYLDCDHHRGCGCEHPPYCSTHQVGTFAQGEFGTPLEACEALLGAAQELCALATSRPARSWRDVDEHRCNRPAST